MLQLDQGASGCDRQRGDNASHSLSKIVPHQLRGQPQYAITEPSKIAITAGIRSTLQFMRLIIHFNHQFCRD